MSEKVFIIKVTIFNETTLNEVIFGTETTEEEQKDFIAGVLVDALNMDEIESKAIAWTEKENIDATNWLNTKE